MASRKRLARRSKAEGRANSAPAGGGRARWLPPPDARTLVGELADSRYNEDVMTSEQLTRLKMDFRSWSGGFPPSDEHQITVYIDYASFQTNGSDADQRQALEAWMDEGGE